MTRPVSKKLLSLIAGACFLANAGFAVANDAIKMGFVSIERILREAAPAKKALQKLEK